MQHDATNEPNETILTVDDLHTSFYTRAGEVEAVRGVSFEIQQGEILGIVGESGSGKSITAKSILGLIQQPGKIKQGEILFKQQSLLALKPDALRKLRGNRISMIFQDPMSALNPVFRISNQMIEVIQRHQSLSKTEAKNHAIRLLEQVGITDAANKINYYPHQFSGGMRQRVMIAMALSCQPDLLIADEPTTALDVTVQAQILRLMRKLRDETQTAILFITHDLGVVAELCDRVMVMYGGLVMESGTVREIFAAPKHPYTQGLLRAIPKLQIMQAEQSESSIQPEDENTDLSVARSANKNRLFSIDGSPPNLISPPVGCPFAERCQLASCECSVRPSKRQISSTHHVFCWHAN